MKTFEQHSRKGQVGDVILHYGATYILYGIDMRNKYPYKYIEISINPYNVHVCISGNRVLFPGYQMDYVEYFKEHPDALIAVYHHNADYELSFDTVDDNEEYYMTDFLKFKKLIMEDDTLSSIIHGDELGIL